MILYVQTPSIPRSELHNILIKSMIEYLDSCKQFSEIRWFVNIDAIKESKTPNGIHKWEDVNVTKKNFLKITNNLNKTKIDINISNNPCFYLAFRTLTLSVLNDIKSSNLKDSDFCVMWLEDDWSFIDKNKFNSGLDMFLKNTEKQVYVLYKNKINMGGNPDIIKGKTFKFFKNINLDKDNKRDPENIRKHDIWYPHIFIDPWNDPIENPPYNKLLQKLIAINNNINHEGRKYQKKILSTNVVEGEQGDEWRSNLIVNKNWNTQDKHGIDKNKSYTYN